MTAAEGCTCVSGSVFLATPLVLKEFNREGMGPSPPSAPARTPVLHWRTHSIFKHSSVKKRVPPGGMPQAGNPFAP